jgi:hypothetical protein
MLGAFQNGFCCSCAGVTGGGAGGAPGNAGCLLLPVIAFLTALTALVPGIVDAGGVACPTIGASFPVYADSACMLAGGMDESVSGWETGISGA